MVRLRVAEVEEAQTRGHVAPRDKVAGAVDEEGAAGVVDVPAVAVDGVVGGRSAYVVEPREGGKEGFPYILASLLLTRAIVLAWY